jgi:MinD-like ATPase involved in chromosome partitioning or flagellar assembly
VNTVLITIVGPAGQRDLALPAAAPIDEFLPSLVRLVGDGGANGSGDDGWRLGSSDGTSLPSGSTLEAGGVRDGDVLYLAHDESKAETRAHAEPADSAAGSADEARAPGPAERTERLLPPRHSTLGRLWQTTAAIVGPTRAAPRAAFEARGDDRPASQPADLMIARRPSVSERIRQAWRSSDYLERLDEAIAAPRLRRCVTIAVVSPKGGVGKTTTTALLGSLLGFLRRDRVVAVDTNPDFGSLGRILAPDQRIFVDDLLDRFDRPGLTSTELDAQLGRSLGGLMVLPAPTDPARMEKLDEQAYGTVIERLQQYVGILLLDCGTGLQEPAARAAIKASDQLVLVSDAEPASASLVSEAAPLLIRTGRPITLVVNKLPPKGARLDVARFGRRLAEASALVVIPSHADAASRLAAGEFEWRDAPAAWQRATRELAVALVSDWKRLGVEL